jgi:hypothetical protein
MRLIRQTRNELVLEETPDLLRFRNATGWKRIAGLLFDTSVLGVLLVIAGSLGAILYQPGIIDIAVIVFGLVMIGEYVSRRLRARKVWQFDKSRDQFVVYQRKLFPPGKQSAMQITASHPLREITHVGDQRLVEHNDRYHIVGVAVANRLYTSGIIPGQHEAQETAKRIHTFLNDQDEPEGGNGKGTGPTRGFDGVDIDRFSSS